jgi:hypothetical protein
LPNCGGPQDLGAVKLHQGVIGIINVAENRGPGLIGGWSLNWTLLPVPLGTALKMMFAPADVAMKESSTPPKSCGPIFMCDPVLMRSPVPSAQT